MSWRCFTAPCPLEMEPGRRLCSSASVSTLLGVVTPGPVCSELLLSGSSHPESLYDAESSCQTNTCRLELLHSQAESYKQQQPGYLLHRTGLLLPLNCSGMESISCHHLYCCLYPMRATIKIKSQGKGPAQFTINQSMSCLHYSLNTYLSSLNTCSHWLDSRGPSPLPQIWSFWRLVKNVWIGMVFGYLMLCEWCLGPGIGGHSDMSQHKGHCPTLVLTIHHPIPSVEKPLGGALPNDNIK